VSPKFVKREILHKSDIGGVVLTLNSPARSRVPSNYITARVQEAERQPKPKASLIAQQVKARSSSLVVCTAPMPNMGPLVLFGTGGPRRYRIDERCCVFGRRTLARGRGQAIVSFPHKPAVTLKGYPVKPRRHEGNCRETIVGPVPT